MKFPVNKMALALLLNIIAIAVVIVIDINKKRVHSRKTEAQSQVKQIAMAFAKYKAEYAELPEGGELDEELFKTLTGENKRGIIFFKGQRLNPWGKAGFCRDGC